MRHELDPDRGLQTIADDWLLYRFEVRPSEGIGRKETITKAIRVHETGRPDVLSVEEVPVPKPSEGEGLVKLEAIGVNFIDVNQRSGGHVRRNNNDLYRRRQSVLTCCCQSSRTGAGGPETLALR